MSFRIIVFSFLLLLVNGCKKSNDVVNQVPSLVTSSTTSLSSTSLQSDDVYVVGYETDGQRDYYRVWKNGTPTTLTGAANSTVEAYSVFASGNDVYVAGAENSNGKWVPVFWKNNSIVRLPASANSNAHSYSIFVK